MGFCAISRVRVRARAGGHFGFLVSGRFAVLSLPLRVYFVVVIKHSCFIMNRRSALTCGQCLSGRMAAPHAHRSKWLKKLFLYKAWPGLRQVIYGFCCRSESEFFRRAFLFLWARRKQVAALVDVSSGRLAKTLKLHSLTWRQRGIWTCSFRMVFFEFGRSHTHALLQCICEK